MMGYCPHVSSLFGSWHRPYLALFEQILHDRAVDIANEYPAGDEGAVPSCVRRPTVSVTFPNGTKTDIANPLYRYDFHPLKYDDFSPLVCP
jgi:tyrosinase